ncbi:MAG: hypothetical protein AAFQ75_04990 [Pseudomonadota bacterium]
MYSRATDTYRDLKEPLMRHAALVLGVIGGAVGMIVGFFGYGFAEAVGWIAGFVGEISQEAAAELGPEKDRTDVKLAALLAPIAGIAGGAMVLTQRLMGAVLLAASAAGMLWGFGFGVFTMFPIAMCGLAAVFALLASGPLSER